MKTVSRLALSGATLLALCACGTKGPLVLPEKPVPVVTPVVPAAPAKKNAVPPVQIKPQGSSNAPTPDDEAAEKAMESGADGNG